MKTFKQFITENKFNHILNMTMNHPREIEDFPHEAHRQLKMFMKDKHEDFEDGSTPPEAIPHGFYDAHRLSKDWNVKKILKNPEETARHLDVLHHHHPKIADHYGMTPMTPEESERITGHESPN